MYHSHPSSRLKDLFVAKPYQGVPPDKAKFLFVGLDANYSASIESDPIFSKIVEYHEDGAQFWRKYNVHHPFLLPTYSGDGKKFHQRFAKIGFTKDQSDEVSFAELMDMPTTGRSRLEPSDVSQIHLERLSDWILNGASQYVFFPAGVSRLLRQSGIYDWIPPQPIGQDGQLQVIFENSRKKIYQHLHFSNFGKFEIRLQQEAAYIRRLISM